MFKNPTARLTGSTAHCYHGAQLSHGPNNCCTTHCLLLYSNSMALDTRIDIEDENKDDRAHAYEKENEIVGKSKSDKDTFMEVRRMQSEREAYNFTSIPMEIPRELDRFLIEPETEEINTLVYNFHLSDNQIIIDVLEDTEKCNEVIKNNETQRDVKPMKQISTDSERSMDDTIKRVLAKVEQIKIQRRTERRKRERLKCLYLVVAVVAILLLAVGVVSIRVNSSN